MRAARGFKFDEFDTLCAELDGEQLQLKWQHYTRALSAASTSTAVATLAAGPTGGVSMIGAMIAGPLMHNARKKRQIIERHLKSKGIEPETRNKDIYGPMGFSAALGGATMGIGSVGAELLAVETMTKIVSHAAIDAGVTAAEDKHSQRQHNKEMEKAGAQLVRVNTTPESQVVPINPSIGQALLNHAKSMPTSSSLGAAANGIISSAARLKVERYPLLKEYLTSIAFQARGSLPKASPGKMSSVKDHHALFPPATIQKHEPTSSSTYLASTHETAFVAELEDTSPCSATLQYPVELDSTPRIAPSEMGSCIISPLSPPSSASHWPSSPHSFVSELEDTSSPGSSTPPTSTGPSELPGDTNTIMSSLLEAIGETTMSELEADLECAVVEMDNLEAWIAPEEREVGAAASTPATKRMSRTFELPADLDSLVRRHSTRFTRRASQRVDGVRFSQYSFVEGEDKLNIASISKLRKPLSQATLRTVASSTRPQASMTDGDQHTRQSKSSQTAASDEKHSQPYVLHRVPSDAEPLPAYSATNTPALSSSQNIAGSHSPSPSVRSRQNKAWVDEKRRSTDPTVHSRHPSSLPFSPNAAYSPAGNWLMEEAPEYHPQDHDLHTRQQQGEPPREMSDSGTDGIYNTAQGSPSQPITRKSSSVSVSSAKSRAGSLALSAHEGMKKVGYFGLEPATKLAIGGSLLLVGVRPSVQRKYLDKAKSKMHMPVEEEGNNGFMGMGKEFSKGRGKQKHRDEDDDYRDYI